MFRSLLVKNCKVVQTKSFLTKTTVTPIASHMFLHITSYSKNNGVCSQTTKKFYSNYTKNKYNTHGTLDSTLGAKILALFVAGGALYFVSPRKHTSKKHNTQLNDPIETSDTVDDSTKVQQQQQPTEVITKPASTEHIEAYNDEGLKDLETVNGETFFETEEEVNQEGAYNPETGEINWDCPCLGGMAHGPCGEEFKEAFACFVYSEADPKGIDCVEKFQKMQDCFRKYPEHYTEQLKDEEEITEQLEKESEPNNSNSNNIDTKEFVEIETPETLTSFSDESLPDITMEETVVVEDVPQIDNADSDETTKEITETIEDIELTENS
ncbi:Mia40p PWA37_002700 [Arxiozyma heterogenica]|uniref:Mia40p n=1 Tax=Arxiozyma heterogenica TaxID=278026 RepID=UPI002EE4A5D2